MGLSTGAPEQPYGRPDNSRVTRHDWGLHSPRTWPGFEGILLLSDAHPRNLG